MNKVKGIAGIYDKLKPSDKDVTRITFNSELLRGVLFEVKDNHIIIYGGECGTIAIKMNSIDLLVSELKEIREVYAV